MKADDYVIVRSLLRMLKHAGWKAVGVQSSDDEECIDSVETEEDALEEILSAAPCVVWVQHNNSRDVLSLRIVLGNGDDFFPSFTGDKRLDALLKVMSSQ